MTDPTLETIIGQNIAKYRIRAGLTQAQLAEAADISSVFVSRVERGQKMMKVATLRSIAQALHVSCDALLSSGQLEADRENILFMLSQQTPENLSRIERVVRALAEEPSGENTPPSFS